jgi:hypothetical protein
MNTHEKSKNNNVCLTSCVPVNNKITHPIYLNVVTSDKYSFCAVKEFKKLNISTGKYETHTIDECDDNKHYKNNMKQNILNPSIDFNHEQFLLIYYDINSFDTGMDWLELNSYKNIVTRLRIFKCIVNAFKNTIEIFEKRFINIFIEIIKKIYISDIYKYLCNYIDFDKKKKELYYTNETKLSIDMYVIERTNLIINTFVKTETITNFFSKYFELLKNSSDFNEDILENMLNNFVIYCISKIEQTNKENEKTKDK